MENRQNETDYLKILIKAIKNVDPSYQRVRVTDSESDTDTHEIARERVFCYELYHQLRLLLGESNRDVNGEIDKSGHRIIRENFNPDIVIHKQGSMDHNELVLEAKIKWRPDEVKKDFRTLYKMTECYRYKIGVFLYIGESMPEIVTKLQSIKRCIKCNDKIFFICVTGSDTSCKPLNEIIREDELCQA
jgi:hypothetical protein